MTAISSDTLVRLKRELSLRDLILFNLVTVISIPAIAVVAKAGIPALSLLLIGAVFFFIPQGLAVNALSSKYPEEGGIYIWTKILLGDGNGFLCGWCYWINNVLYYPMSILATSVIATYALGQSQTDLRSSLVFILPFTLISLWTAAILNITGMKRGKWLQNIGGICTYLPFIILAIAGGHAFFTRPSANSFAIGEWKLHWENYSALNLWASVPFAYAGLELVATLGSEIKNARINIPRSIFLSAPLIALLYLAGTASVLHILPSSNVDVIGGVFQAIKYEADNINFHLWWIASLAAGFAAIGRIGSLGAWIAGSARVAFVIGLDKYFPPSFGRIHPKWNTPHIAILVQTVMATIFLLMAVLGKGTTVESAFFILLDMQILLYFIPYVYLFICFILFCYQNAQIKTVSRLLQILIGACGLIITVLAMIIAAIPPPATDPLNFELKTIGGSALLLLLAGYFYFKARVRSHGSARDKNNNHLST